MHAGDVFALGGGGFGTVNGLDQRFGIFLQLDNVEGEFADGAGNVAILVELEVHFTSLGGDDGLGRLIGHGASLGIRHQTTRTEDPGQFPHFGHGVGGGDGDVEVQPAFLNLLDHVFITNEVRTGFLGGLGGITLGEYQHLHSLTGTVWEWAGGTDHLVTLLRIDTHAERDRHGLVELRCGEFLQRFKCVFQRVEFAWSQRFSGVFVAFASVGLGHVWFCSSDERFCSPAVGVWFCLRESGRLAPTGMKNFYRVRRGGPPLLLWVLHLHIHAHLACCASDDPHGGFVAVGVEVRALGLGHVSKLLLRQLAHFFLVRNLGTAGQTQSLLDQSAGWGLLGDEREGLILVNGDHDWEHVASGLLRGGIELFTERHDVHTGLTERGTHGRSRIGGTSWDL